MNGNFGLYLILTDPVTSYETCASAAVTCGVRYLQLRMKNTPRETVHATAKRLREITSGTETLFIMNDDLELAMLTDADGVHLGQTDMDISEARRQWTHPGKHFGLSTHSMEQAIAAQQFEPDLIGIGPVFPTQTKTLADPALGPAAAGDIAQAVSLTSVAIGGINEGNLKAVLAAGFHNFCVVSAVNASPSPVEAIQTLQKIWKNHRF